MDTKSRPRKKASTPPQRSPRTTATAEQVKTYFLITEDKHEARANSWETVSNVCDQEKAAEIVTAIVDDLAKQAEENGVNLDEWTFFDRITWVARQAYIMGFVQGWAITMEAEEDCFIKLFGADALGFAPGGFEPTEPTTP